MNIEIKYQITCDQSGTQVQVPHKDFDPPRLVPLIAQLVNHGWSITTWRNADGNFSTYTTGGDRWNLYEVRPDGAKRQVRHGLNRSNLWVVAPKIEPDPPFTQSALAAIEAKARFEPVAPEPGRVRSLEAQVAYLTAQIERINTQKTPPPGRARAERKGKCWDSNPR